MPDPPTRQQLNVTLLQAAADRCARMAAPQARMGLWPPPWCLTSAPGLRNGHRAWSRSSWPFFPVTMCGLAHLPCREGPIRNGSGGCVVPVPGNARAHQAGSRKPAQLQLASIICFNPNLPDRRWGTPQCLVERANLLLSFFHFLFLPSNNCCVSFLTYFEPYNFFLYLSSV